MTKAREQPESAVPVPVYRRYAYRIDAFSELNLNLWLQLSCSKDRSCRCEQGQRVGHSRNHHLYLGSTTHNRKNNVCTLCIFTKVLDKNNDSSCFVVQLMYLVFFFLPNHPLRHQPLYQHQHNSSSNQSLEQPTPI